MTNNCISLFKHLFLVLFLLLTFSSPVSADSAPACALFTISHQPSSSEPFLEVSLGSELITDDRPYTILLESDSVTHRSSTYRKSDFSDGESKSYRINLSLEELQSGRNTRVHFETQLPAPTKYCSTSIQYKNGEVVVGPGTAEEFNLCTQAGVNRTACDQCLTNNQIWTGVGCIPFSTGGGMVRSLITLGLGITGTIVVIMTLYAGFMFSTSQGDPKRVDEAKSAMTSAIIGAFFIIFSVTILQFIGVTILRLPSFG